MLEVMFLAVLAPLLLAADVQPVGGTQWNYRGSVEAQAADASKMGKTFDLTLWILQRNETGAEIFWLVDEQGRGEFPWSQRFGRTGVDAQWNAAAAPPALLYDRGEAKSVVAVPLPFLASEQPLAAGADFRQGKLEFHVERATKAAERAAWKVSVRDAFGPKRTLVVDQHSPAVYSLVERLTLGRGEAYQLNLELLDSEQLPADRLAALTKAIDGLSALSGKLNRPPESQETEWKSEQLATLRERLPRVVELAAGTPLAKLVAAAGRDLELQSGRSDAVAELSSKFSQRAVDDFSAKGSQNETLARADLQGHVTVLHFWEYRDEPLKEPYGQVGYLEYMYHRRKPNGVQVYGVAVDGRLGDDKTRAAGERSVRKLKSFMNLTYPVLLDSGSLLKQFGDPRLVGATLPLFVVVGPDQKVLHYHVGHYDVHQDQGLKELDEVVRQALEKK